MQWTDLRSSLDEKLKFCEKIHLKHHEEVGQYEELQDVIDRGKFNMKIKRIGFELYTEGREY